MKPIAFHKQASAELDAAAAYYEERRAGLGIDFLSEVDNALVLIARVPQAFAVYKTTPYRKCLVGRFPFSIFYMERDDDIWVAAVAHARHRPDYWRRRKPS